MRAIIEQGAQEREETRTMILMQGHEIDRLGARIAQLGAENGTLRARLVSKWPWETPPVLNAD